MRNNDQNTDFEKLDESSLPFGPEELDAQLKAPEQLAVRKMVKELSDEPVSLVWRSDLNERLRVAAVAQKRRSRIVWIWRPALGLGLASVLAVTFLFSHNGPQALPSKKSSGVEAALLQAHRENVAADDLAGAGLNPTEVDQDTDFNGSGNSSTADAESQ